MIIDVEYMKKIFKFCILFSTVLIFCSTVFSQNKNSWDNYKYRTLSEIGMNNPDIRDGAEYTRKNTKLADKGDYISANFYNSRVRVLYLAKFRPITNNHKEMLKVWAKLQGMKEEVTAQYENEYLFRECNMEYWIPLPKSEGNTLEKKQKDETMLTVYLIVVGARKAADVTELDWLYLAAKFEK